MSTSASKPITIAIIDDEEEILNSLNRVLRKHYCVKTFVSAESFLASIPNQHVDIVLSDIRMPHMDGFALMRKLKAEYPAITRLCMSGYADMDECQQAIDEQLFEFIIAKPWDNFELKQLLKLFTEKIQLQQALDLHKQHK